MADKFSDGGGAFEVQGQLPLADTQEVNVRICEAGKHDAALEIDQRDFLLAPVGRGRGHSCRYAPIRADDNRFNRRLVWIARIDRAPCDDGDFCCRNRLGRRRGIAAACGQHNGKKGEARRAHGRHPSGQV